MGSVSLDMGRQKKINLDGPAGLKYYWHYLRKELRTFSLMIWLPFAKMVIHLWQLHRIKWTQYVSKTCCVIMLSHFLVN